jgi:hypothetical protein
VAWRTGLRVAALALLAFGAYGIWQFATTVDAVAVAEGFPDCEFVRTGSGDNQDEHLECHVVVVLEDQRSRVLSGRDVEPGDEIAVVVDRSSGRIREKGTVGGSLLAGTVMGGAGLVLGIVTFVPFHGRRRSSGGGDRDPRPVADRVAPPAPYAPPPVEQPPAPPGGPVTF